MSLLDQTDEERDRDLKEQSARDESARARGLVPRARARSLDFIERSIEETERQLLGDHAEDDRARLEDRLTHLREELARLSS